MPKKRRFIADHHEGEKNFSRSHPGMPYHPANFYFNGTKYSPDFYDPVRNVFFEVAATRQAFHQIKNKINEMKKHFPRVLIRVVNPDGSQNRAATKAGLEAPVDPLQNLSGWRQEMGWVFLGESVRKHRESNGLTRSEYAKICGISMQSVFDIENEKRGRKPSVAFLEKVTAKFPVSPLIFFVKTRQRKNEREN